MKDIRVILMYLNYSSFVEKDVKILEKHFEVKKVHFKTQPSWIIPFQFVKSLILLFPSFGKKTIVISRHAAYHSVIPSLYSKLFRQLKHYIILGGSDSNYLPSLGYGMYGKKMLRGCIRYSIKNCTRLLPVSRHLIYSDYSYSEFVPKAQGVKAFYPNLNTEYTEIYNGFDTSKFSPVINKKRTSNSFVTVAANISSKRVGMVKGVDLIVAVAKELPDYHFTIIGTPEESFEYEVSENVEVVSFVDNVELPNFYSQFEFYLQVSMIEGFPNSLCEAMSCGCIPIVSQVGILPEIISDTGYVLQNKSILELKKLLQKATNEEKKFDLPVKRIRENYTLEAREQALLEVLTTF